MSLCWKQMKKTMLRRIRSVADLFDFPSLPGSREGANDARTPDWQERERALDVRRSWVVEAPAGSGKTGLLIQRFLKLLSDESVEQPEQVLAITFTVKATAEMRERVMAQLEAASEATELKNNSEFELETRRLADAVLRKDALLGWGLLERPRRLRMQTIDSVCGEIARSLPVLSGSGGQQSPVDDPAPMYREAARRTLMQLGGADAELDAALRVVLLHRDGSLAECERLLMEMLPLRNQWGELVPLLGRGLTDAELDRTVLPRLQKALEQGIGTGLTRLSQSVPGDVLRELSLLAGEMGRADGYKGAPSPIAMCAGLNDAPEEIAESLGQWLGMIHLVTTANGQWRTGFRSQWLKFDLDKSNAARLKSIVDDLRDRDELLDAIRRVKELPPAVYPQEQWKVAKALFRVLSRALVELQLVFARTGQCDFAELGLQAKLALEHGGLRDLSEALGVELRHMLVDEMQDTSTSQYELLELLTQGWDGQSQTLFLVGDPKQSIYLFRQARVERFVRMMQTQRLGEIPLGSLQLTANFRSQRGLVDSFNEDFSLLFPADVNATNPEEVPYVEAQAVRGATERETPGVVWHARVLDQSIDGKLERRKIAREEAAEVRAVIEEWRARPLPAGRSEPWKIAILVRSRNVLGDIVKELKDETRGAIPFRAVEIEELGERQEVLDLFALTRALLHPADRVAWLAVLHAPWCGLGLADLHVLAGGDDPLWVERNIEDAVRERGDLLSEESCARLMRVWPVLQAAREDRSELTITQRVERTWRSLGGDTYLAGTEQANAKRYLQLLDEMEVQSGGLDVRQLERRLKRLFAEPAVFANAVDVMTIHRAKGLEWDVVLVPGLEKKSPASRERLLNWCEIDSSESGAAEIMLAPIAERGEGSKELNEWLKSIARTRDAAERKRLFYVACTRAREELHLFASPERNAKGKIAPATGTLLKTAWPVAERYFIETEAMPRRSAKMFEMSLVPGDEVQTDNFAGDLAASAEDEARPAVLQRLALSFDTGARFAGARRLSYGEAPAAPTQFERPEGSFEARVFGNAMHALIESMTKRLATGMDLAELKLEVAGWTPRITAVLRGDGLQPGLVKELTASVKTGLNNMLNDADGAWLLGAREGGSSEFSLTSWNERHTRVRLDRVFLAGGVPQDGGTDFLWIVDYKTSSHGREGIDEFLARERESYGPQMETYARMMKDRVKGERLRLGLYYPMLPRLVWWAPESETD
jgi:ATP-dependent helicase/nuclease subunit A